MEKYHKQDVAPIEKENERDENYKSDNPQIDSERTRNNYRFTPYFGKTYTEFINGRIKELGLSPRKDAVVMNSFVLGSDKTFFDGLIKVERYNFFSDCYQFFAERYGVENVIAAVVHNDETTPHSKSLLLLWICYAVEARFRGIRYKSLAAPDTRPQNRL